MANQHCHRQDGFDPRHQCLFPWCPRLMAIVSVGRSTGISDLLITQRSFQFHRSIPSSVVPFLRFHLVCHFKGLFVLKSWLCDWAQASIFYRDYYSQLYYPFYHFHTIMLARLWFIHFPSSTLYRILNFHFHHHSPIFGPFQAYYQQVSSNIQLHLVFPQRASFLPGFTWFVGFRGVLHQEH